MGRRVSRHRRPALDRLAGGSVVHELAGAAALATAVYLRRSHQLERPHSVPLGAGTLWFGWFGFNAGSAVSAGMGIEWWRRRKPSGVGIATGAVAGLAAITPASGYVQPCAAIIIGAAAGLLCYGAVRLKDIFRYDDSLDVVGVHMVGGAIGVLLTGVFASLAVNAAGEAGVDPPWPPGSAGRRRNRLPVRHDLDHLVGHRPHRRAAGGTGG